MHPNRLQLVHPHPQPPTRTRQTTTTSCCCLVGVFWGIHGPAGPLKRIQENQKKRADGFWFQSESKLFSATFRAASILSGRPMHDGLPPNSAIRGVCWVCVGFRCPAPTFPIHIISIYTIMGHISSFQITSSNPRPAGRAPSCIKIPHRHRSNTLVAMHMAGGGLGALCYRQNGEKRDLCYDYVYELFRRSRCLKTD